MGYGKCSLTYTGGFESRSLWDHWQPRVAPGLKAADDIGRPGEAERLQGGGRQAGLVALVAHQDDLAVDPAHRRVLMPGGRIKPPLEHVASDAQRPRHRAVGLALALGADVDEQRAALRCGMGILRGQPTEPSAGLAQQLVDRLALGTHAVPPIISRDPGARADARPD